MTEAGRLGRKEATARVIDTLRDVGIADAGRRLRQHPHQLSGGLLQRVMIASVLVTEPRLILADEPTTALDVTTQQEVMAILDEQRRSRGLAMIFITHDLELAIAVTDRIAVMYAGVIVEEARPTGCTGTPSTPTRAAYSPRARGSTVRSAYRRSPGARCRPMRPGRGACSPTGAHTLLTWPGSSDLRCAGSVTSWSRVTVPRS